ncbi:Oidioi.mRNA.OKI2018_I69.XSR.g13284.t1.cds [Oikopleura dioica]|uniref:Oidioi.mRNA.OKI2018_I69.XSR.g13284.t1.cds n=1 Tax=Oikopleura dioica TaxID=34765 RepID=A0ABN7SAA3_OIKDI|nr:Oidioi.mRNA.OKI2018_I69.XSR.g13284.t1.cds [Oikopleura dioica]
MSLRSSRSKKFPSKKNIIDEHVQLLAKMEEAVSTGERLRADIDLQNDSLAELEEKNALLQAKETDFQDTFHFFELLLPCEVLQNLQNYKPEDNDDLDEHFYSTIKHLLEEKTAQPVQETKSEGNAGCEKEKRC